MACLDEIRSGLPKLLISVVKVLSFSLNLIFILKFGSLENIGKNISKKSRTKAQGAFVKISKRLGSITVEQIKSFTIK